jgi:hypothetical protein
MLARALQKIGDSHSAPGCGPLTNEESTEWMIHGDFLDPGEDTRIREDAAKRCPRAPREISDY